jgi:superfamily II DNA or RNA helicase
MTPYDYQIELINNVLEHFKTKDRLLLQLSTGGG